VYKVFKATLVHRVYKVFKATLARRAALDSTA
jgi:hypothetical protein